MNRKLILIALIFILTSSSLSLAAPTGASFLKHGVGARSNALAGAYSAKVQDASALYWNPAALANLMGPEIYFYHSEFILDSRYQYAAYTHPLANAPSGFGFAYGRLSQGTLDSRDDSGNLNGDFKAYDSIITASFARKFNNGVSLGVGANFLQSEIGSFSSTGWALDFTSSYNQSERTRFTAGILKLGPEVKFLNKSSPLPTTLGFGASHQLFSSLGLSLDSRYRLHDQDFSLSLGVEFNIANTISFQTGLLSSVGSQDNPHDSNGFQSLGRVGMGVGLNLFSGIGLDYAFVPVGDIGTTHHISLKWRFHRE